MSKSYTQKVHQDLQRDWREHQKLCRRTHMESVCKTYEEYVAYRLGRNRHESPAKYRRQKLKWSPHSPRGSQPHIQSATSDNKFVAATPKKEYTGTLIKGIATMHKSNAVPVISEQHAKDISNMRRNNE